MNITRERNQNESMNYNESYAGDSYNNASVNNRNQNNVYSMNNHRYDDSFGQNFSSQNPPQRNKSSLHEYDTNFVCGGGNNLNDNINNYNRIFGSNQNNATNNHNQNSASNHTYTNNFNQDVASCQNYANNYSNSGINNQNVATNSYSHKVGSIFNDTINTVNVNNTTQSSQRNTRTVDGNCGHNNGYNSAVNMRPTTYHANTAGGYNSKGRYYGDKASLVVNENDSDRVKTQSQSSSAISNSYGRVTKDRDYDVYNQPSKKKNKMSIQGKTLIIVIIAVLILVSAIAIVNKLPNAIAQPGVAQEGNITQIDEKATGQLVGSDGQITDITLVPAGSTYKYDSQTNWFDRFCDWVENLVG